MKYIKFFCYLFGIGVVIIDVEQVLGIFYFDDELLFIGCYIDVDRCVKRGVYDGDDVIVGYDVVDGIGDILIQVRNQLDEYIQRLSEFDIFCF